MITLLDGCIKVTLAILVSPVYWIAVLLVIFQLYRVGKLEKKILGHNRSTIYQRATRIAFFGLIGGSLGSVFIVGLGVAIHYKDFIYLMITALVLLLFRQRFICFAYSGGIVGLLHLITGYPKVDIPSVMAMIAILHLIESFLVYIDGDAIKIPIFIEVNHSVVGGFSMMSFWPVPFIIITATYQLPSEMGALWDGWPFFHQAPMEQSVPSVSYLLAGLMTILGYSDIAISSQPKMRTRKTSKFLFIYSSLLMICSILALKLVIFKYIAVIFCPLAHEAIIKRNRKHELEGIPRYRATKRGVKVLDVVPEGVGAKLGLKTGDILYVINGQKINGKQDIKKVLYGGPKVVCLYYYDDLQRQMASKVINAPTRDGIRYLSILIVPKDSLYVFDIMEDRGLLSLVMEKMVSKNGLRVNS